MGRSLVIRRSTTGDSGLYTCDDRGDGGMAYVFIHPRLQEPSVQVTPNYIHVSEGSSVELQCNASGIPKPVVVWNVFEHLFSTRVVVDGSKLQIHNAIASDSGTYVCIASNMEGKYHEALSTVVVGEGKRGYKETRTDPSIIAVLPEKFEGPVGSTVTLRCNSIHGPSFQWNRQSGEIPYRATYTKGNRELIITDAQVNDSGVYSCIARHESGDYYIKAASEVSIVNDELETRTMPGLIPEHQEMS